MSPDLTEQLLQMKEYSWSANGQSVLSGALLDLHNTIDNSFLLIAKEMGATEYMVPAFIDAAELAKCDYLQSFPHLVTFPVTIDDSPDNLQNFVDRNSSAGQDHLCLTQVSPLSSAMTPAACYHFYIQHQNSRIYRPALLTCRANCFRRESSYSPLKRQWSFSMREIVCMGSKEDVQAFLELMTKTISKFCHTFAMTVEWQNATDPFFKPTSNPKCLTQKLDPLKQELLFEQDLAICSTNFHRTYFGERFNIQYMDGPAYTGCVAFGLERWIYAVLATFGTNPHSWMLMPGTIDPFQTRLSPRCNTG